MQLMVLKDGETYSGLAGCAIIDVADEVMERLEAGDVRASDFEEHGTKLVTFHGGETSLVSLTAEEREFVTDAMDAFEENLQLDSQNHDWDGRKWGSSEERLSESIAQKIRQATIADLRSEANSEERSEQGELQLAIFPLYPAGSTGDAIEEITARTVAELLPALERATRRMRQGIFAGDGDDPRTRARVLELTLGLLHSD